VEPWVQTTDQKKSETGARRGEMMATMQPRYNISVIGIVTMDLSLYNEYILMKKKIQKQAKPNYGVIS
jgi:hypothetical protein